MAEATLLKHRESLYGLRHLNTFSETDWTSSWSSESSSSTENDFDNKAEPITISKSRRELKISALSSFYGELRLSLATRTAEREPKETDNRSVYVQIPTGPLEDLSDASEDSDDLNNDKRLEKKISKGRGPMAMRVDDGLQDEGYHHTGVLEARTPTALEAVDVDCDIGKRPYMEDALVALQDITVLHRNPLRMEPLAFLGVYDGHGGDKASRFIQKCFHLRLLESLSVFDKVDDALRAVFMRIDHDYMKSRRIPEAGLPPLPNYSIPMKEKRKPKAKRFHICQFRKGEYVDRIAKLQKMRMEKMQQQKKSRRGYACQDSATVFEIDQLIRDRTLTRQLTGESKKRFVRELARMKTIDPEMVREVAQGKKDVADFTARENSLPWQDTALFTSDEEQDAGWISLDRDQSAGFGGGFSEGQKQIDSDADISMTVREILQEQVETIAPETVSIEDGGEAKNVADAPVLSVQDDPMVKNPGTPGSTATVCLVDSKTLWTAWCGDSEAVLYSSGGEGIPLVDPHRPLRKDERARVIALGGFVTTQYLPMLHGKAIGRVQGQLSVSRAVGDAHLKRWVPATPEINRYELTGAEEFVVIATDGLWDVLSHRDVGRLVRKYIQTARPARPERKARKDFAGSSFVGVLTDDGGTTDKSRHGVDESLSSVREGRTELLKTRKANNLKGIHGCARYLIKTALSCGSADNISVIVLFFKAALPEIKDWDHIRDQARIDKEVDTRRGLFSSVGLFKRARIRRVFARGTETKE